MFYFFRDAPDVTTRLTIYLYYKDKDIYRQMEINLININLININRSKSYILNYKITNNRHDPTYIVYLC